MMISWRCVAQSLCSPNEDFGTRNRRSGHPFRLGCVFSRYFAMVRSQTYTFAKTRPAALFRFPKSSFGEQKKSTVLNQPSATHPHFWQTRLFTILPILCSPNEDFGTWKKMWVRAFVSTFHTLKYSIWAESDEKCLQNVSSTYFSTFRNLRLGTINFFNHESWLFEQCFENTFPNVRSTKWSTHVF